MGGVRNSLCVAVEEPALLNQSLYAKIRLLTTFRWVVKSLTVPVFNGTICWVSLSGKRFGSCPVVTANDFWRRHTGFCFAANYKISISSTS